MKRFLQTIALIISLVLAFSFISCGKGEESGDEEKFNKEDNLVKNFWNSDVMYDETVILVAPTNENGEITGMPSGKLLFEADEIISVKQYFHADNSGIVEFAENVDFTYDKGTITAKGELKEDIEGKKTSIDTKMPYITDKQWKGKELFPGFGTTSTGIPSNEGNWDIPYTESYQIVQLQISVTYRHSKVWEKGTPSYQGQILSNVIGKLKAKQDTNILIFGDSISTGSNSSSILKITPNLAPWYQLMAEKLSRHYKTNVVLTNKSMGGWTSAQGVSDALSDGWVGGKLVSQVGLPKLLETDLKEYSPDLVIIGFGMNDATLSVGLNNYANNIKRMINCVRERNPKCDVILLGTMLANPEAKNQYKNQTEYSALNTKIASLYENVACVDIGKMHQDLLDSGKKYMDMTGNNVNHPNDFMARIYAMNLLATLIEA